MIATATRSQPRFPWPLLTTIVAVLAFAVLLTTMASTNPRFNPQTGDITRSAKGTTIALTWQSTGDGYCQISGGITLPDKRTGSFNKRVVAPCQGQDVRGVWEKLVEKIFRKFSKEPDLLKDQIIPVIDTIRSILHNIGI